MSRLYMLIGIPGSGKSTWAKEKAETDSNIAICSSDAMRKERGLAEDDKTIFVDLHNKILQLLKDGKDVIYDATNINRKRRMNFLQTLPENIKKIAVLFIVDPRLCKERQMIRERIVPEKVIDKMLLGFQLPGKYEGFDDIVMHFDRYKEEIYIPSVEELLEFNQDNPHHKLTLGNHLLKCRSLLKNDKKLNSIGFYHDIGKYYTKTFDDDGVAHYFGHENIGAYYYLLSKMHSYPTNSLINKYFFTEWYPDALLINWHMRPFAWEQSPKCAERERKLLGDEMFDDLMKLHWADVESK